jgi:two-component system invasion response regulator UvrY
LINVLVVDDHELVRAGIRKLLADANGIRVIGEAESGEHAITFVRQQSIPDVVLLDLKMPGLGGLETTKRLVRLLPSLKVLILSSKADELFAARLLQSGAVGFLTKGCHPDELIIAVRKVYVGQRYLSPEIAHKLALQHVGDGESSPLALLSERELQIMQMITQGLKVQDIADRLCVSTKTINSYRYRLFDKLKVSNDVELTHMALRHGLIEDIHEVT